MLFAFSPQAKVGRVVAKSKVYQHATVGKALRERFVNQVDQILWQYKLAPETVNLPATLAVPEIQVFDIALKSPDLDVDVLAAIDRAIPLPIVFQLHHAERMRIGQDPEQTRRDQHTAAAPGRHSGRKHVCRFHVLSCSISR